MLISEESTHFDYTLSMWSIRFLHSGQFPFSDAQGSCILFLNQRVHWINVLRMQNLTIHWQWNMCIHGRVLTSSPVTICSQQILHSKAALVWFWSNTCTGIMWSICILNRDCDSWSPSTSMCTPEASNCFRLTTSRVSMWLLDKSMCRSVRGNVTRSIEMLFISNLRVWTLPISPVMSPCNLSMRFNPKSSTFSDCSRCTFCCPNVTFWSTLPLTDKCLSAFGNQIWSMLAIRLWSILSAVVG